MSKPKWTPGPWEAGRPDMATLIGYQRGKYIYAGKKYIAAAGFDVTSWKEIMANANLIAAAPELYEACKSLLRATEEHFGERCCACRPEPENSGHVCECCDARAAIAKAEGRNA